jgi:hypothetical protein
MPFHLIPWLIYTATSTAIMTLIAAALAVRRAKGAKPATESQFEVPTAEEGRPIPVLFGTRRLSSPNVVWYGDLKIVPITKKVGL